MRFKLVAGIACVLSVMAAAASADTTLGWYVAADVGVHDMDAQKLVVRDVTLVSSTSSSYSSSSSGSAQGVAKVASAEVAVSEEDFNGAYALDTETQTTGFVRAGNQLTKNWRVELEYGERPGKIKEAIVGDLNGEGAASAGRGSLDLTSLMVNVLYDISPDSRLHPFIGAGVGAVQVKTDYTGVYAAPGYSETYAIRSKKTVGAAQAVAGLAWAVSDRLNVDLTYRYLETGKVDYDVAVNTTYSGGYNELKVAAAETPVYGPVQVEEVYNARMSGKIKDHSLTLGLRWLFGAPPPAAVAMEDVAEPEAEPYRAPPAPVVAPIAPPARRDFTVYFPFDSAKPTADGEAVIAAAAQEASNHPGAPVTVTGHADTSGSASYNVKLSQNRARMVANGLVQMGVPASVITTDWRGESQPAVATPDGVKKADNRRATIVIGN